MLKKENCVKSSNTATVPKCQNECYLSINCGTQCGEVSSRKYQCSRIPNHDGPHVACGLKCELDVWEQ